MRRGRLGGGIGVSKGRGEEEGGQGRRREGGEGGKEGEDGEVVRAGEGMRERKERGKAHHELFACIVNIWNRRDSRDSVA